MIKVTTKKFRGKKAANILKAIWDRVPTGYWWESEDHTVPCVVFVHYYSVVDNYRIDNEGNEYHRCHYHLVEEVYKIPPQGGIHYEKVVDTWCNESPAISRSFNNEFRYKVSDIIKDSAFESVEKFRVLYPDIVKKLRINSRTGLVILD